MSEYREIIVKEYHNEKGLITRREVGEELVRCKDCKYYDTSSSSCTRLFYDPFDQASVRNDDFCSFGEVEVKEMAHER